MRYRGGKGGRLTRQTLPRQAASPPRVQERSTFFGVRVLSPPGGGGGGGGGGGSGGSGGSVPVTSPHPRPAPCRAEVVRTDLTFASLCLQFPPPPTHPSFHTALLSPAPPRPDPPRRAQHPGPAPFEAPSIDRHYQTCREGRLARERTQAGAELKFKECGEPKSSWRPAATPLSRASRRTIGSGGYRDVPRPMGVPRRLCIPATGSRILENQPETCGGIDFLQKEREREGVGRSRVYRSDLELCLPWKGVSGRGSCLFVMA
ncbi:hypothetical protein E2C01_010592 [Portunus trituberculatus]|uniref:Uncharacterized protein n=1 Tax=Portunus trituberculatus TaxID=210409 RepID=A0A5B7D8V4_PORTR|nr:hypothetical protein [Portunus trituberculatus]